MTTDGKLLVTGQDIKDGQNVWQSMGGQEVGSIWGHGAYVAPDWSADWLHKEAVFMLDGYAMTEFKQPFDALNLEEQAMLKARLQKEIRANTFNKATGALDVSPLRAAAIASNSTHYTSLFTDDSAFHDLRDAYAIPDNVLTDPERIRQLNAFFFWTSWACVTNRPGSEITYTNNWPAEEQVANKPTSSLILWTGFSVILLLAGVGGLAIFM